MKKRLFIIGAIVSVVLAATIAGVALAQTNDPPATSGKTLMGRVAAILGIDQQKLEDAFAQAQREMADEALDARLKKMVESGRITQEQADSYRGWWESRPEGVLPGFLPKGKFGPHGSGRGWRPLPPREIAPAD